MLSSWKEIAHFFGKGVRTVQRWEKTLDLPIHRPPGAPSNVVLARTSDLEEWMHRGPVSRTTGEDMDTIHTEVIPTALNELQREVTYLAQLAGVSVAESTTDATLEGRLTALTDVVARANEKVAARSSATRAA